MSREWWQLKAGVVVAGRSRRLAAGCGVGGTGAARRALRRRCAVAHPLTVDISMSLRYGYSRRTELTEVDEIPSLLTVPSGIRGGGQVESE
jgi:hypothetical protein